MTIINSSTVTATIVGSSPLIHLDVLAAQITLDEYRAPYVDAQLTIVTPSEAVLAAIDPRVGVRVLITYTDDQLEPFSSTSTRTFDLLVHVREYTAGDATVRLTLVSDEALLIDMGYTPQHTSAPVSPWSLRAITNSILGLYGTSLQAGAADADYTPYFDTTNDITNPTLETNITNWTAQAGSTVTRSTASFHSGAASASVTAAAASSYGVVIGNPTTRTSVAGEWKSETLGQRRAGVWVRTPGTGRTVTLNARVYDDTGASITLVINSLVSSSTWQLLEGNYVVGSLAVTVDIFIQIASAAAAQVHYFDDAYNSQSLVVQSYLIESAFFTGATAATSHYTYSWEGVANASRSIRTRVSPRDPQAIAYRVGSTDWDYLHTLVQAAGLRLFCDEARKWRLVAATYTVTGTVAVELGVNITAAADTISLRGDYYDGVAVVYRTIVDGTENVNIDWATTSDTTNLLTIEYNTAFPGAGAAAAILARALGRGREQDIRALTQITATPGNALTSLLPDIAEQVGLLSAVTFNWATDGSDSDEMSVRPRDLEDA